MITEQLEIFFSFLSKCMCLVGFCSLDQVGRMHTDRQAKLLDATT